MCLPRRQSVDRPTDRDRRGGADAGFRTCAHATFLSAGGGRPRAPVVALGTSGFTVGMSDAKKDPEPLGHVFDQTNGALGEDTSEEESHKGARGSGSPKFGVPPIVSL